MNLLNLIISCNLINLFFFEFLNKIYSIGIIPQHTLIRTFEIIYKIMFLLLNYSKIKR